MRHRLRSNVAVVVLLRWLTGGAGLKGDPWAGDSRASELVRQRRNSALAGIPGVADACSPAVCAGATLLDERRSSLDEPLALEATLLDATLLDATPDASLDESLSAADATLQTARATTPEALAAPVAMMRGE